MVAFEVEALSDGFGGFETVGGVLLGVEGGDKRWRRAALIRGCAREERGAEKRTRSMVAETARSALLSCS